MAWQGSNCSLLFPYTYSSQISFLVYEAPRTIVDNIIDITISFGREFFTWVNVCRQNRLWGEMGYMGTSGNRDYQWVSRSVLIDFAEDIIMLVIMFAE